MDRSLRRRRTALRFESLIDIPVPRRFFKIDMALDLLGEQLRPDDWGYARKFGNLPFSYQVGAYLRHQFEENEGRWHLTHETIPVTKEDRGIFFALKLMFEEVSRRFIRGCEEARFEVALLDPHRGVLNFPKTTAVTTQSTAIFETGLAFGPENLLMPLPVVVDKTGYKKWLDTEAKADEEAVERNVSAVTKQRVFDAVRQFARENEVLLGREWLWDVFREALKERVTRNQFDRDWKLVPSQEKEVSRPTVPMKTKRNALTGSAIRVAKDAVAQCSNSIRLPPNP